MQLFVKVIALSGTQNNLLIQRGDRSINSKGPLMGSLQDKINEESSKFGDIIQGTSIIIYVDSDHRLVTILPTFKSVTATRP